MKNLNDILHQKVNARRSTMRIFNVDIPVPQDRTQVRIRLANDPALKWLSNSVADAMVSMATEYVHGAPISPFKVAENLEFAFAEVIMLWEECNNDFNNQLEPPKVIDVTKPQA